jgi:hypothetical protein
MSIGNLKDYGNKGNNFPWQLKVLEGIQRIYDYLIGSNVSQQRTPVIISDSGSGGISVTYGFSIANVGGAAGTVNGVTIPAGTTVNFAPDKNNSLNGITYDATGTTFLITWIQ